MWISRELNHKNILVHESAFVEKMMLCVVTEFMNFGKNELFFTGVIHSKILIVKLD